LNNAGDIARLAGTIGLRTSNALSSIKLMDKSIRDPLTGLFNRRFMNEFIENEINQASRHERTFGLMMIDMDYFKEFNDRSGHLAGDLLLKTFSSFLKKHFRSGDLLCRFGGDEFLVIMHNTNLEKTLRKAELLSEEVRELKAECETESFNPITLSIGVSAYPDHGPGSENLIQRADEALYRAKTNGRNRVEAALPAG